MDTSQLKAKNWAYIWNNLVGNGLIEQTLPGGMSLHFICDIQMVGSKVIDKEKSIDPFCFVSKFQGSLETCNGKGLGDIFLAPTVAT